MNERTPHGQDDLCVDGDVSVDDSRFLRTIVEGTSDAIFTKDRNGRYRLCNASAARFIGKRSEDILGQDDYGLFPLTAAESIREQDRRVMADAKVVTFEETLAMADGAVRTFLSTKGPIVDRQGRVSGVFGIARDITDQKRGERALHEAHTAVELAMEGIAKLDATGRYLFANTQYAALLGYQPEELVGQSWEIAVHPDDHPAVLAAFSRMITVGKAEGEFRGIRKDGTVFDKHVMVVKAQATADEEAGHYCFVKDITDRKLSERQDDETRQLLASITRVQSLFIDEVQPEALWKGLLDELLRLTNSEYGFIGDVRSDQGQPVLRTYAITNIAWNDETRDLMARQAPTLEFRNLKTLFGHVMTSGQPVIANDPVNDPRAGGLPPGHPPMHAFLGLPFFSGGVMTGMVGIANRPGGYDEALVAYLQPLLGTCGQLVEGFRNKRLHREAEQALRLSEDRFRAAMQGANDGIWDWDLRTNEVYFSERWKTMLGYDDQEIANVYSEWESRLHPDDHARVMSGLQEYLRQQQDAYDVEFRLRRKDGTYCWIHARGKAVWDIEGRPTRMAGSHTDITERKREEALQVAEKQTLELVAQGTALREVLTFLCRAIESHTAPMLSSIMLVTEDGSHLSAVAGPSLSDEYSRHIDHIPIGPTVGSCGSAAYFRKPTIVFDIATDPLWTGYADVALTHGLQACWSQPILSSSGLLLGTFGAYFREPRQPCQQDLRLIDRASHIAALAIEHARTLEALEQSEERFRLIFMHEPECVKTVAPDGVLLAMNPTGLRMVEADSLAEVVGRSIMPLIYSDDRSAFWNTHCAALNGSASALEFRILGLKGQLRWMSTHSVPLRDAEGAITAVLSVTRDITERKQLEQASQDQHDRLQLAMDIAGLAIWDWNILTNQVIWSDNCEQVKRLPAGSFEGTFEAYQRLVHPEDLPGLQADIERALSGQRSYHTEHRIVPPTGEVQWIEGNGVVYRDELGRPIRMVGTVWNITERKRTEQTLRVNEERYARATAVGQVGVWELDVRTGTYYGDKNLKAMFGYQVDELSSDPSAWLNLVFPDDQSVAMAHWQRIVAREADDYNYEVRMVRKDGTVIWTEVRGHAVRDQHGELTHLIGATLDITARKRSEAELRLFRTLTDHVTDSIEVIDPSSGRFLDGNRQSYESIGYTRDELLALTVPDIDPLVTKQVFQEYMQRLREANTPLQIESLHLRKDGTTFPVEVVAQIIRYEREYVVAVVRDITARKRMESALAQQTEHLRLFIEHSPVSLALLDQDMRYLAVSRRWREEYRVGEQPLIGRSHYEIFPEIPERWKAIHRRCLAGAVERCEEDLFVRADGRKDWSRWEIRPWHTAEGTVGGIVIFAEDITARKQAEAARETLQYAIDHGMEGFALLDQDGQYTYMNEAHARIYGFHASQLIGRSWKTLYDEDLIAEIETTVFPALQAEGSWHGELIGRMSSGVPVQVEIGLQRLPDSSILPEVFLCTCRDITIRKHVEEHLQRTRFAMDQAVDAVYWIDPQAKILYTNAAANGMLGYTAEEFLRMTVHDLNPNFPPEVWPEFWAATREQKVISLETIHVAKDGRHIPVDIRVSFLAYGGQEFHCAFVRDISEQKRVTEALRASQERFELAARASNDGIWDWNLVTGEQYWSDRHLELFGLAPSTITPTYDTWISLVHPDDVDRVHQATRHHLATRQPYDIEVRARMKDGSYRWFRDQGQAVWDSTGRPVRMVGTISDVTVRRNAEEMILKAHAELEQRVSERTRQLAEANQSLQEEVTERKRVEGRLRTTQYAVDHAADQIFIIDANGAVLDANESACKRLGYTKEELLTLSVMDIDPDFPRDVWSQTWKDLARVGQFRLETRHRSKSGEIYPVEVVANYLNHEGQELDYAIVRDITERRQAEAAIRDSELRYKLLTEATFDGIAIHDQGILLEVNAGLERMFGYAPGELIGRSLWDLIAEESRGVVLANMNAGMNGPYEAIGRRKDGSTFPGEIVVRPYRFQGKDVRLVAGRDITERKHLERERRRHTEELEHQVAERTAEIAKLESQRAQAERLAALGRLAAGVAHEINNPIAGIKNAFTLVRQAVDPAHPNSEFAGLIDREIARVASIIQNMYQLCRPESRKAETVDLVGLVKDLDILLTPQLQQRRLKFIAELGRGSSSLCVPRGDLVQVLLNLLTNAIDCSPEGETITLSLREDEKWIQLAVCDQGGGIAPEHLPRIFDPFYTTKTGRDQKGMGLGLSVSQSLVQAMGGMIEVNTQPGRGSTFVVFLPAYLADVRTSDGSNIIKEVVTHDH